MGDSVDNTQRRPPLRAELQAALNLIPAFAWCCNASGGLTFLNERGSDYLGLPKDHPIRHGIDSGAEWDSHIPLLHPDDHEEARRVWSTCLRTGCAGQVSFRVRNAEGGYRWHLSRAEPVRASDGILLYWIGVNLDIEDRKQTEFYLAEGQRLARTGSWAFNAAGFDYWSPELFRIYGLDPSGKAPTVEEYIELVHPDDREFVAETIQKRFAEHRGFDFTKRIVRPDGEIRHVRCVGGPATHAGAVQKFIGTEMDVTEHELLTQELGRHEAYLAEAQRLSHTGSFGWKPDTDEIIWSAETYRTFEYDRAVTPTIDLLVQRVHPEDRADFQSVIERASRGASDIEHAYRLLLPDGRVKHVHALAHATQDAFGNREFVGAVTDITEQRRAEESLLESEFYLAEAQKLSQTGSWAWSPDKGIRYWSEECYRLLGFDPHDGLPRVEELAQRVHPDDQPRFSEVMQRVIREKVDHEIEYRIVHPGGAVRDILNISHPVLSPSGELIEFLGTAIDVTERKRAERESQTHLWFLESMDRIYRAIQGTNDLEQMMGDVLDAVLSIFACDRAWLVYPCDPESLSWRAVMERIAPRFPGAYALGVDLPVDAEVASLFRLVRSSSGAVRLGAGADTPVPTGLAKRFNVQSQLCMAVYPRVDSPYMFGLHQCTHSRVWTREEEALFEAIGRRLTDTLTSLLMFRNLQESEARLEEAQRIAHVGYWVRDLERGVMIWSDEAYRIFGLQPQERVITFPALEELFHPEDRQRVARAREEALRGGARYDEEYRVVRPGGEVRIVHSQGDVTRDESGQPHSLFGTMQDITERKIAEEALRSSEAYLAEAQRMSHTGSWANTANGEPKYWSEECYRVLGFDPAEPLPSLETIFQRIHPDDRAAMREELERGIRDKADFEVDMRFVHPITGIRNIRSICHAVLDRCGDLREMVGTVIDITERKKAEEELRASESKYRHLVDTTPAFVHTALPGGDLDFLNHGWLQYVGLPLTDLLGWRWTSAIHPEDVEAMVAAWRASLDSGERFVAESRVRRADGHYCWFLHRKEPLRNEAGEIVKWYGSSIEIEERRIAEEKIREQEKELRQILDLTPQHIGVFGPDGTPLNANRGALEYFGITLDQWRNQETRLDLVHPDDREHFLGESKNRFLEGVPHEFEARLLRHDGTFRYHLFRLKPVKDERGRIIRWYSTAIDIEDRKRAEEEVRKENIALREEIIKTSMFEEIVGNSPALQQVLILVAKVAPTDSTVLITGETGTGKELIARAIHKGSKRSDRAFVSVNCAAIPQSLISSELFGHEKGAFTGATGRRLGRFELAEGGTIFLDEVGELPPETQVAILRVLQEHEFERVGGSKTIRADVRVIGATNRDLQDAMAAGTFRSDLFYRLSVFPIEVPPLRQRREDIPMLVEYFIDRYAREAGKKIASVSKETLDLFQSYPWPGNIRELRNVIERSIIVCETENFSVDESWLSRQPLSTSPTSQRELRQRVAAEEKLAIEAALTESHGRVYGPSGAAAKLGIARSTLESKIKILNIDKNRFKISSSLTTHQV
jgi:PAS domain S-box-containing protein